MRHRTVYRKRGAVTVSDEVAVSRGGKEVWDKLEGGGTEYSDSELYHVAGEPGTAGGTGGQTAGGTAPNGPAAVDPGSCGKKRGAGSRTLTARNWTVMG